MKWMLSIFLIILLSCVTNLNGQNNAINEKTIQKMIVHMTKIKNLLRNLEEEDTTESGENEGVSSPSDDQESSSEESGEESSQESGEEKSQESGEESSQESGDESSQESGDESSRESGDESSQKSGDESSVESESQASEQESQSSPEPGNQNSPEPNPTTPPNSNEPITRGKKDSSIKLLAFNNFVAEVRVVTFVTVFYFHNRAPPLYITFTITIMYGRKYRNLQEGSSEKSITTCKRIGDSTITNENVKYNCSAPKEENASIDNIKVDTTLTLQNDDGSTMTVSPGNNNDTAKNDTGIFLSEEAIIGIQNLQNQTKTIDKYLKLENGELLTYSKYFIIKGDIDNYDGKVGDILNLTVYDNTSETSIKNEVSCRTQNVNKPKYEFRCTPTKDVKGIIYLSPMYSGDTSIILNMTAPNSEYVNIKISEENNNGNTTSIRNNPVYKKSSSGLSGGAIAGIVIACAVVLIIASIVAMMLRKPSAPVDNTSSVVGLRTIDNYSQ